MLLSVTLHLAGMTDPPKSHERDGHEIIAALEGAGRLNAIGRRLERDRRRGRGFRPGWRDLFGWLIHWPGGDGGVRWVIGYDDRTSDDDETIFMLDRRRITLDESIATGGQDADLSPFSIASVVPLHAPKARLCSFS
jgi:hypothetical protein